MYTAHPNDEITDTVEEVAADHLAKTYERLQKFAEQHSGADFAGLSPMGEKVQYNHQHRSMKRKGGKSPQDFTLAEEMIDFQRLVAEGNLQEALPYYYRLSRLIA